MTTIEQLVSGSPIATEYKGFQDLAAQTAAAIAVSPRVRGVRVELDGHPDIVGQFSTTDTTSAAVLARFAQMLADVLSGDVAAATAIGGN